MVVAVVAVIVINVLANALPFNGQNTGEISDRFQVYFVPAGYVFAIWGLIYIGLIAYAIFQALPAQRDNLRLQSIFWPVIVGSIANIVWIILWHYDRLALTVPVIMTDPRVGVSMQPIRLSSVDLPLPEGPVTTTTSPAATSRSTSSSSTRRSRPSGTEAPRPRRARGTAVRGEVGEVPISPPPPGPRRA